MTCELPEAIRRASKDRRCRCSEAWAHFSTTSSYIPECIKLTHDWSVQHIPRGQKCALLCRSSQEVCIISPPGHAHTAAEWTPTEQLVPPVTQTTRPARTNADIFRNNIDIFPDKWLISHRHRSTSLPGIVPVRSGRLRLLYRRSRFLQVVDLSSG